MNFIILRWRCSFVLKLKKLYHGVDKNFPRYSKLMLCLSAPGEQHLDLDWLVVRNTGNFARLSLEDTD